VSRLRRAFPGGAITPQQRLAGPYSHPRRARPRLPRPGLGTGQTGGTAALGGRPDHDNSAEVRQQRAPRSTGQTVLEARGIEVRFGAVVANRDLSLSVRDGITTGLVGPNGAGKTTCFNVLTGALRPTKGNILLAGQDVTGRGAAEVAQHGVARTFQNLDLFDDLTVAENVQIGATRFATHGILEALVRSPRAVHQKRAVVARAKQAMGFCGLLHHADTGVSSLPYGVRRRTEIARALALEPRVLLLDEPTAGMDPRETVEMGQMFDRIVDGLGVPILLVEHDMSLVEGFVDYVYVLEFGEIIAQGTPTEVLRDARVVNAYLGSGTTT
jgi:branched-chain amino acid transport system ATP-binding protein